jgi:hypothetical protein
VKAFDELFKYLCEFKKKHFEVRLTWDWDDPTSTSPVRRQALLTISFALTFTVIPKEV